MDIEPDIKGDDGDRDTIARQKKPGKKKASCYWDGKRWSHGGVVEGPNKKTYKCVDGEWVEEINVKIGDAEIEREATPTSSTPEQAS